MVYSPLVLLLNKPKGITSHTVIKQVQKSIKCKKIGHCGTLDKFASGLLIVLLNNATRLSQFFLKLPKTYIAEICFGETTDTLDPEGAITGKAKVPQLKDIQKALSLYFIGTILQRPPQYSAIHVNGERASNRVRKGEQVVISPRKVDIFSYSIIKYESPKLTLSLHVSSGTYIRSIAHDLAQYCNSVAYVSCLERDSIADILLQEACSLSSITDLSHNFNSLYKHEIQAKMDNEVHEDIDISSVQSICLNRACLISPEAILERLYTVKRCYTDEDSIRDKVTMGILPSIIINNKPSKTNFIALHDRKGLVGIWETISKYKKVC